MKSRFLAGILTTVIVAGAIFTGCSQGNKAAESKTSSVTSTISASEKATLKATENKKATEKTTASEKSTQAATQKVTQKPVQKATQAPTQAATQKVTQKPVQKATQASTPEVFLRTDGSILTKTGYTDKMWAFTMTFPESWQKNNILVLNNYDEKGRTLSFVEKTNYASNKNFGLIFRLEATYEPVEDNNNYKNLGSFTDANGKLLYLSIFTPSDVRADLSDKALTENYRQVFGQKNNAVASIFMYN